MSQNDLSSFSLKHFFLRSPGTMGKAICELDWSETPLGPIEGWSQCLKTSLGILLNSRHPMWMAWGENRSFFYNDAFISALGPERHEWALGQPTSVVWADIWDFCGPLADQVFQKGEASFFNEVRFFISRGGVYEETFCSFGFSPIFDETGRVGGLFCPYVVETQRILSERRFRTIAELSSKAFRNRTQSTACLSIKEILAKNVDDVPFALLYLEEPGRNRLVLKSCIGLPEGDPFLSPLEISWDATSESKNSSIWPIADLEKDRRPFSVDLKDIPSVPRGLKGQRVPEAVCIPLQTSSENRPIGYLIAGRSPARRMDSRDLAFYEMMADQIAIAIHNASLAEEEKRRVESLMEVARIREEASRRIEESDARMRAVVNNAPIAMISLALDGTILIFEGKALEGLHLRPGEIVGKNLFEICANDTQILENARRTLRGETFSDEVKFQGRFYDTWYSPIRDSEGNIHSLVAVAADITERIHYRQELVEAKEIAEKANVAKSRFLANMSHEIRTPVAALTGFSQLLKREGVAPEERDSYLAIIERNSEQLMRLIDDILDLSKVESGKMTFEKNKLSMQSLLQDLRSFVDVKGRDLNIEYLTSFRGRIPESIQVDSIRLKQILTNVIGNAMKFTRAGRVELAIFVRNGLLCFEVKDDGPGISRDEAETLFCPFVQADSSITNKFGGTGLGLALSRGLARSMGGDVELVETAPGKGCRFEIRIDPGPLDGIPSYRDVNPSDPQGQPAEVRRSYSGKLVGRKILLVEDTPDNRTLIKAYLKDTGASIQTAFDGVEGVEMARKGNFDIALMDIQMPRRDGYEATRMLREEGYRMPIVALTAHAMNDEQDRCLRAGCTVHLSKPVDRSQLIETIANLTKTPIQ